jgi:hypothetical protein
LNAGENDVVHVAVSAGLFKLAIIQRGFKEYQLTVHLFEDLPVLTGEYILDAHR